MKNVSWYPRKKLEKKIEKVIKKTEVVVDIGCGIRPQNFFVPQIHFCVDPHLEYLETVSQTKPNRPQRYFFINATWDGIVNMLSEKSVDTVFLLDIIEHLDKGIAKKLLKATEKIARGQIVLFTPIGFVKQEHPDGIDAWGLSGGKWQTHKSGWNIEDFGPGWKVYACKVFHKADNLGNPTKPFGAMYAVKNYDADKFSQLKAFTKNLHLHSITFFNQIKKAIYD